MKKIVSANLLFSIIFVPLGPRLTPAQQSAGQNVPASIKALFRSAETITLQHRELSPADIAAIEAAAGKLWSGDEDVHVYLAIGTEQGKRLHLGAATVAGNVPGAGDLTIAYDNDLNITKVIAARQSGNATSAAFLGQFVGKNHDDPLKLGQDVKYSFADRATAEVITDAVRCVTATMQRLYGKAH